MDIEKLHRDSKTSNIVAISSYLQSPNTTPSRIRVLEQSTRVKDQVTKDTKKVNVKKVITVLTSRHAGEKEVKKRTQTTVTTTNTKAVTVLGCPPVTRSDHNQTEAIKVTSFEEGDDESGYLFPGDRTSEIPRITDCNRQQNRGQSKGMKNNFRIKQTISSSNLSKAPSNKEHFSTQYSRNAKVNQNIQPIHKDGSSRSKSAATHRRGINHLEEDSNTNDKNTLNKVTYSYVFRSLPDLTSTPTETIEKSLAPSQLFTQVTTKDQERKHAMAGGSGCHSTKTPRQICNSLFYVTGIRNWGDINGMTSSETMKNTDPTKPRSRPFLDCGKIWTFPSKENVPRKRKIITCYKDYLKND